MQTPQEEQDSQARAALRNPRQEVYTVELTPLSSGGDPSDLQGPALWGELRLLRWNSNPNLSGSARLFLTEHILQRKPGSKGLLACRPLWLGALMFPVTVYLKNWKLAEGDGACP